jgi:hypothetical protein
MKINKFLSAVLSAIVTTTLNIPIAQAYPNCNVTNTKNIYWITNNNAMTRLHQLGYTDSFYCISTKGETVIQFATTGYATIPSGYTTLNQEGYQPRANTNGNGPA